MEITGYVFDATHVAVASLVFILVLIPVGELLGHLASPDIALLRLFSSWPLFGWESRSDSLYPGG